MSYEMIAMLMFSAMMLMLLTGQRVFAVIGSIAVIAALLLWGDGGSEIAFSSAIKLMKWYPLLTLPLFIYMGYMLSESGIAEDLYRMFHVWMGPLNGGLAIGTIGLMVVISAMNGLSVAGMAIGASIALPELLRRGYDKIMVTGVIQAGSSLGILVPPSVVLVLYGMIARQPVGQLWLAGVFPGLLMATLFIVYIVIRCKLQPNLGPALPEEERNVSLKEKLLLLRAGITPLLIFVSMTGLFLMGVTSLVESSAVGATAATIAAIAKRRLNRNVMEETLRKTLAISCMFMWIILAALCFGAVFDGIGAVKAIEGFFIDRLNLTPWQVLILMQLSYLLMGTFLDDTAMLVIVAPLYVPLVGALGFDLLWYGVLYTITCQIAYMTPPFGYNLFLMRAMAPPEISLKDIYLSIIPFVLIMIFGLILVMAFPQLALWLPEYHYGQ
ncbi:putative TRAP-type C4-dicarboxylate transport system, large permease component [Vibrio nigripulchritudo MADA3029]|uniref:TRAP-type C4-dicarboxylate transport system, large permease component n=2 Tax=Vibrio nigripulchritudo TaxID=28173 RepID=A0AAV2VJJ3_9VIBR|nr:MULTISPECIES: TRAP transporter large permease subunit [Vibrio]EGU50427.1 TRAP C4-dicarboxylate transport system permease DctM subunit [Vibrio nigripulchritudo ATCC 27043]UAB71780.1 TRAP transporter large permease subunit [Vibrio sp. SCSIO 43132]CCN33995.1 putative TRAP-type C4-dicarboxylate transport system, large permease component [Vibrio nigripulchritudo AM115]CCN41104.1 putative TRAP-type C4-dicarboxylate transport system, large permease component [Vibrio nigripulchritudo FTn2]CCN45638.